MPKDVLDAFCALKAGIDAALREISECSDDHFGIVPDDVNWAHVNFLHDIETTLDDLANRLMRRGEFASGAATNAA